MNLSFDISTENAKADLVRIESTPLALERPLVILGGLNAPRFSLTAIRDTFARYTTTPELIVASDYFWTNNFDALRAEAIALVDERFPTDDPLRTTEVDVIAVSMGGLVARYAAMEPIERRDESSTVTTETIETTDMTETPPRRLNIRTLFTLASPHRGAKLAPLPTWDQRQRDMRPGSDFLAALDDALPRATYRLICYTLTRDELVGERNTYPLAEHLPGPTSWGGVSMPGVRWLPARPGKLSHFTIHADPRIVADILRELRGEPPLASPDAAPLPGLELEPAVESSSG